MYMWNKSTLINVILSCLDDRTEMAHSIEARTPFLDHHLAEYVNALPPSTKLAYTPPDANVVNNEENKFWWKAAGSTLRSLTDKWILREAARPTSPTSCIVARSYRFWHLRDGQRVAHCITCSRRS